ncbi:unnamed product [Ostreococcus tauri]|uniref:Unnamed product n=1 Tax=Ostreococcus tauri TaxID=70448 RepID=A0A090M1E4_OSTTA|nr:unnamed product [Ostreococcus tauri]CEF98060.1 unnamed product [Ostreococcus tauri]|eukprot:XP_022839054.1 unnamed product [Ostreococcus tauri]
MASEGATVGEGASLLERDDAGGRGRGRGWVFARTRAMPTVTAIATVALVVVGGVVASGGVGETSKALGLGLNRGRTTREFVEECTERGVGRAYARLSATLGCGEGEGLGCNATSALGEGPPDVTFVDGFWFAGPPYHHSPKAYAQNMASTACMLGSFGAKVVFVRDSENACAAVLKQYNAGVRARVDQRPEFTFGPRDGQRATCRVMTVDSFPIKTKGCKWYFNIWLNKVSVVADTTRWLRQSKGPESALQANTYFWLDGDRVGPHDHYYGLTNVTQALRHVEATNDGGISPFCYHGSPAFSVPMGGGGRNVRVGDIVTNSFAGTYDGIQLFQKAYNEFLMAQSNPHVLVPHTGARLAKGRGLGAGHHGHGGGNKIGGYHDVCPREERVFAEMAKAEQNPNFHGTRVFSKKSCIFEQIPGRGIIPADDRGS